MHHRNPYRTPPDFVALASAYPELKQFIRSTQTGSTLDYGDQAALRVDVLLEHSYIATSVYQYLCLMTGYVLPLNYILWLQDILDTTTLTSTDQQIVRGIDIGTGASAIYPLLGCATNSNWHFYATDIDNKSIAAAQQNVAVNHLEARVKILRARPGDNILPSSLLEQDKQLDFTMCNPPFYRDREEVLSSAEAKEVGPSAVCTGADTEMITPGGEVAFVRKMVLESLRWGTRCKWFTSMLGKMSSLAEIVELLRTNKIENYAITEFVQGRTRRWAIAWSFSNTHLPDTLARIRNPALQSIMPPKNTLRQPFTEFNSRSAAETAVLTVLRAIDGVSIDGSDMKIQTDTLVQAVRNTWSRAARRQKVAGTVSSTQEDQSSPALRCRIRCIEAGLGEHSAMKDSDVVVEFDWVEGDDRGLFESFVSHMSRKLKTVAKASDIEMAD